MKPQKPAEDHINVKVIGPDEIATQFKIKKRKPLAKMMSVFLERGVSYFSTIVFSTNIVE